jgi:hypothetical protein
MTGNDDEAQPAGQALHQGYQALADILFILQPGRVRSPLIIIQRQYPPGRFPSQSTYFGLASTLDILKPVGLKLLGTQVATPDQAGVAF